jgi:hypothetical protein
MSAAGSLKLGGYTIKARGKSLWLFPALIATFFSFCQGSRSKEELMRRQAAPSPPLSSELSWEREAVSARLPHEVRAWTRSDKPRIVTAQNIFEYMDGAGELYIGYRFLLLDVYDYTSTDLDDILVEIYWMGSSDDAFGLLSNDWGGEAVDLGTPAARSGSSIAPGTRALYGAGLLRIWSGNLYARVMAYRDSEAARSAVLDIGRSIVAGRESPAEPALLKLLPTVIQPGFRLRADRLCYFRSHLVLNSVYFLSTGNILDLGLKAEAVTAPYEAPAGARTRTSFRALLIRYSGDREARAALSHFLEVYVPEKTKGAPTGRAADSGIIRIEDGWMGYRLNSASLGLVFECPGPEVARSFLNQALKDASKAEAVHE